VTIAQSNYSGGGPSQKTDPIEDLKKSQKEAKRKASQKGSKSKQSMGLSDDSDSDDEDGFKKDKKQFQEPEVQKAKDRNPKYMNEQFSHQIIEEVKN